MSEESDALLHIADDHPCCKPTLLWTHNRLLELERELSAANNLVTHHQNHVDDLIKENATLREKLEDPARLHAHCVRYLTDAQVSHLFGERMTAIQNNRDRLEAENAALRAELAPLRETVGVAATASTCADDLSNWSKLVERADNSTRLERENAELLDLVESMAHQHCQTVAAHNYYNGQVPGTMVTDSGALSVNGQALRLLAQTKPPRFRVVAEFGRMVVGYWPENDPQKEAQP